MGSQCAFQVALMVMSSHRLWVHCTVVQHWQ